MCHQYRQLFDAAILRSFRERFFAFLGRPLAKVNFITTIYVGDFITMNERAPKVEAVAVSDQFNP